jgi:hypothetical protein
VNQLGVTEFMMLDQKLAKHKKAIFQKWFNAVVETYPADTAHFLKSQKDPFANPVGSTTQSGLKILLDNLFGDMEAGSISNALDPIIRIRAVQNFSPSHAVGFVFLLKKIIREHSTDGMEGVDISKELFLLDERIDDMGLMAFDIFSACREKIFELKNSLERDRLYKAFFKAGLVAEVPEENSKETVS